MNYLAKISLMVPVLSRQTQCIYIIGRNTIDKALKIRLLNLAISMSNKWWLYLVWRDKWGILELNKLQVVELQRLNLGQNSV